MRRTVAIVLGVVMLFVGLQALGLQSQEVRPDMANSSNITAGTYNATNTVFEGAGTALSLSITWMGMSALVLLSGGLLVYVGTGGR